MYKIKVKRRAKLSSPKNLILKLKTLLNYNGSYDHKKMKRLPTDLQILNSIYNHHYDTFKAYSNSERCRKTKIFVPIDIRKISNDTGVDEDIIFGRLYYDLEKRYSYKRDDGPPVSFFLLGIGDEELHCINFPYLASVLASLRDENRKYRAATSISIISLAVSAIALFVSVFK